MSAHDEALNELLGRDAVGQDDRTEQMHADVNIMSSNLADLSDRLDLLMQKTELLQQGQDQQLGKLEDIQEGVSAGQNSIAELSNATDAFASEALSNLKGIKKNGINVEKSCFKPDTNKIFDCLFNLLILILNTIRGAVAMYFNFFYFVFKAGSAVSSPIRVVPLVGSVIHQSFQLMLFALMFWLYFTIITLCSGGFVNGIDIAVLLIRLVKCALTFMYSALMYQLEHMKKDYKKLWAATGARDPDEIFGEMLQNLQNVTSNAVTQTVKTQIDETITEGVNHVNQFIVDVQESTSMWNPASWLRVKQTGGGRAIDISKSNLKDYFRSNYADTNLFDANNRETLEFFNDAFKFTAVFCEFQYQYVRFYTLHMHIIDWKEDITFIAQDFLPQGLLPQEFIGTVNSFTNMLLEDSPESFAQKKGRKTKRKRKRRKRKTKRKRKRRKRKTKRKRKRKQRKTKRKRKRRKTE